MPISKAQQKAVKKYCDTHYRQINLRVKPDQKDKWTVYLEKLNQGKPEKSKKSINKLIIDCVDEVIARSSEPQKSKPSAPPQTPAQQVQKPVPPVVIESILEKTLKAKYTATADEQGLSLQDFIIKSVDFATQDMESIIIEFFKLSWGEEQYNNYVRLSEYTGRDILVLITEYLEGNYNANRNSINGINHKKGVFGFGKR